MDPEKSIASLTLDESQIKHLLNTMGGPTGSPLSPLTKERFSEGEKPTEMPLFEDGLFDFLGEFSERWNEVFRDLLQPSLEIIATVGFSNGRKALCGYGPITKTDRLIGFTPINDSEYRLTYPLSKDHFLSLLVADLGLDIETLNLGLEAEMTLETLLTLAGMIDAGREARLEAMLARYSEPDWEIPFDRILYNTREGLISNDYRWLASAIQSLFPFEFKVTPETLLEGLNDLQELGWVENQADELWSFTETFDVPRIHLESLLNFGSLSIHHQDQRGIEGIQVGILRTMATIWSLDYQDKALEKPLVHIETVSGPNLAQVLQHLLEGCLEKSLSSSPEIASHESLLFRGDKNLCPQCHTPGQPGDRFCSACGAAIK